MTSRIVSGGVRDSPKTSLPSEPYMNEAPAAYATVPSPVQSEKSLPLQRRSEPSTVLRVMTDRMSAGSAGSVSIRTTRSFRRSSAFPAQWT